MDAPAPFDAIERAQVAALMKKLKAGKALNAREYSALQQYGTGKGLGSAPKKKAPKKKATGKAAPKRRALAGADEGPPDVLFDTQREAAALMGVHYNTIGNWFEAGHGPGGDVPWSLKDWCVQLRAAGKLSRCKPTREDAHAVWTWAFTGDMGEAINPDDPVHAAPVGWQEEQQRQVALAGLTNRRRAQIELETLEGVRIPVEEYRRRRTRDREQVLGHLDSVHAAVRDLAGLTLEHRGALNQSLADWVLRTRNALSQGAPVALGVVIDGTDDA